MAPDDVGFLEWAFKGAVAIIFTVGGWLWIRLMNAVAHNEKAIEANEKAVVECGAESQRALDAHKLHLSENYAKKSELTPIYNKLDEIGSDIKVLVGMKREREK